jgi:putative ABC transport system permease protein
VKTLEQSLSDSIAPRRFNLLLLGSFAFVALILAALGVYGVIAYSVAERTHEIGIRLALGAERRKVVAMIVRQGMAGVVVGIVIGIASALGGARVMASLLYDVEPTDPATFALATVMLAAVAFIACAAPALRAAAIDPATALRSE